VNSKARTVGRVGAVGAATMLGVAALAVVAPAASAAPCGYYKTADYDMYNHCGPGNAYLQIDQVVGNYFQCVGPGNTILRPPGDYGIWEITNAFYLRRC
jgi:hypothetical protein